MKIVEKMKWLLNCCVIGGEDILNGIGIEYISGMKKWRDKGDEIGYYFMIDFECGLVMKVEIYSCEIEVGGIVVCMREVFINGIGDWYISVYEDEMMDVEMIRYYDKEF